MKVRSTHAVRLYSTNKRINKLVEDWLSGEAVRLDVVDDATLPSTVDLMLSTSKLSRQIEMRAARMGAMPVVVPEGLDYAVGKILAGKATTIAAYDYGLIK